MYVSPLKVESYIFCAPIAPYKKLEIYILLPIYPDIIYSPTFLVECDRSVQERCHRRVGCMICMYTDYTDYKLQITWPCYLCACIDKCIDSNIHVSLHFDRLIIYLHTSKLSQLSEVEV